MTAIDFAPAPHVAARPITITNRGTAFTAFAALLLRDFTVLRRNLVEFLPRVVLQPLLLVFVFTYVFPQIGQGIGGAGSASSTFSTLLVAGVIGTSIIFQGMQSTALPLVQEFGITKEIEDRVLAPLALSMVAVEKIVAGALQCLLAALVVFPIAWVVPATPVHLHVHWLLLITIAPIACVSSAALGLTFGTIFKPRTVPILFGVIVVPITFLGCVYYPWSSLAPIPWLKWVVLVNPLVYVCEGFRAALTDSAHMPLWGVYGGLLGFAVAFTSIGIHFFTQRVLS